VYIITGVLVTLFLCLFLLSGFGLVETAVQVSQRSPGAGLPMVIVYVVIPAAALLMIGAQVVDLRNAMKGE
jgi:TRAP-type C4-dicarboxylate transport system permease small subunit